MTKFVAPLLRGRMPPGIFSYIVRGAARFPGDPWPHQLPVHQDWYWMHSDDCRADPAGSGHALCIDRHIATGLREQELEGRNSQQVLKATAARPDATDRERAVNTSPAGGPMGAGQLAAASPAQCDLFIGISA